MIVMMIMMMMMMRDTMGRSRGVNAAPKVQVWQLMQQIKTKEGINWDTSHAADASATTMRDRKNVREMPQVGTQHE